MDQHGSKEEKTNGRWTKEEHERFMLGLQLYGKDWKKIEELVATRNGAQIRSHAQKFFIKLEKQFTPSDHEEQTKEILQTTPPFFSKQSNELTNYQDYSNFLQKIFKLSTQTQQFDFWENLIDQKQPSESQNTEIDLTVKRKSSFVTVLDIEHTQIQPSMPYKKLKM